MTLDDVRQLDVTLQARGETLSANKIVEHLGGSKRDALPLLRQYRAETQPPPAAPASVPYAETACALVAAPAPPPPPLPLLAQAELEHQAAVVHERQVRRALASPGSPYTSDALAAAVRRTRQAQALIDSRQRSATALQQAVPELRIAARRSAGEAAGVAEQARRAVLRAQRAAAADQETLEQAVHDLVTLAGVAAVPGD